MRYADIKKTDIANGTGVRVSLFVQGCAFHCKGCFNQETWDFAGGKLFTIEEMEEIHEQLSQPYIQGLSILGGEPLHTWNVGTVHEIVKSVKAEHPDKDIWLYTGSTYETLNSAQKAVLDYVDVLVDGAFKEAEKVIDLRFRGSTNQRIIDVKASKNAGNVILHQLPDWEGVVTEVEKRLQELYREKDIS